MLQNRNAAFGIIVMILLLAAGFRIAGINKGLPLLFNHSETDFVDRALMMTPVYTGQNDFNPHFLITLRFIFT